MKSGKFHASRGIWNIILLAGSRWVAWCYAHLLTGRTFWCLSAPWRSLLNSESDLGSNSGLSGNGENVYPVRLSYQLRFKVRIGAGQHLDLINWKQCRMLYVV
ncbi:hypothetical protein D5086_027979 [Populus alba]|uniref:Uncharacterized protein n=1 Tax=Populus alba TaxID=43335 RepID=A0ACC4AWX6_POPAL